MEEKWDVTAEGGGESGEILHRYSLPDQNRESEQDRGRIAGAPAQPGTGGDFLLQIDVNLAACLEVVQHKTSGAGGDVVRDVRGAFNDDGAGAARCPGYVQAVGKGDCLKDRSEFVVVVGALIKNAQAEVDFGEGLDLNSPGHWSYFRRENTS